MHLPSVKLLEDRSLAKRRTVIGLVVALTLGPSLYLAFNLVQKEWFDINTGRYIQEVVRTNPNVLVLSHSAHYPSKQIQLTLAGERLSDAAIKHMEGRLPEYGIADAQLVFAQSGQVLPDINAVKKDILQDFMKSNQTEIIEREARIASLQKELEELRRVTATQVPLRDIYREVSAQFPNASQISVTTGFRYGEGPASASAMPASEHPLLLVQLKLNSPVSAAESRRLRMGLRVRAGLASIDDVQLTVENSWPRATKARRMR